MPGFGRAMLAHFPLATEGVYLNHGTVGVTPSQVMRARAAILDDIEHHPARFMIRELMKLGLTPPPEAPRLRAAAARVAAFLGVAGDGLVFVDNASTAINAVLRSLSLQPGDEILISDQTYGGVARAAAFIARERGATLATIALPFPARDPAGYVAAVAGAITARTRLALLDHVCSETALVLPLAAMAAACRTRGVPVLVDGAHAPGAIELDISALGVDWYAANLHKWAFAPRSCGVLWAAPERRAGLHPNVISWGVTNDDWLQEFDWTGTRDPSPWLAAPAGLDFMHDVLGVEAMRGYNHRLAWQSAEHLARRWGQPWTTPEAMVGCMVSVPLPARLAPADAATASRLRDALLFEHDIECAVIARGGALWARLSLQVYNDESDIERLARAVDALAERPCRPRPPGVAMPAAASVVPVVRRLAEASPAALHALAELLIDCVEGGASVSFMLPLSLEKALAFWRHVAAEAALGRRVLLVAEDASGILGTVQVILEQPENQPHRADVAKMLVLRRLRRQGIGAALMRAAEDAARAGGKTLLVLDTASADAERLYASLGWQRCGVIPGYALLPQGGLCATTYFYRQLDA